MADNQESGFVIRDKRGQSREEPEPRKDTISFAATALPPSHSKASHEGPPLSFSTFILSLGTSALMLMGERLSSENPALPVNLPQAKEIIDILRILEEKTKSNLTEEETNVLHDMLYTLQMKYVELASRSS
ncbi:MAG: DUF1844 domain-containing protein [Nitrospira sp. SB0677_bin_15]|nr:DUF1844 domain-containing protein [Nitrospira sp. SB0667_bin_9]MYD30225.1 DUF1844 domain-containing protein [Nitrospira sp. SB0661_bin_20]MYG41388.1 DUF1844 domain-containing protein [Nitrospira sp. SB0677_bin_15]MYH02947.1 DUF1844 domain-containing protein [Nitrospira sp. SB0675_bin_23]